MTESDRTGQPPTRGVSGRSVLSLLMGAAAVAVIVVAAFAVPRMRPKVPVIDLMSVVVDTVRREPSVRLVHGVGALTPDQRFHVAAPSAGRVEEICVPAGGKVSAGSVIARLRNLDLEQQAADAAWTLQTAESDLVNLKAQIRNQRASHLSELATLRAQHRDAVLKNTRDQALFQQGLMLELDYKLSTAAVGDLAERIRLAEEQEAALNESFDAQLASKEAAARQLREMVRVRRDQLDALQVRAGLAGKVDQVLVQAGQQVAPGADLALVVQPQKLVVDLAIPESQAREVAIGQKVTIEAAHGAARGHVARIDPSAVNGTRTVDVWLDTPLPPGAAPNESADGTIEVARLDDAFYIGRPAHAAPGRDTTIFRIPAGGKTATRVRIALGGISSAGIQVLRGLEPGDQVILSDIPAANGWDQIRLR